MVTLEANRADVERLVVKASDRLSVTERPREVVLEFEDAEGDVATDESRQAAKGATWRSNPSEPVHPAVANPRYRKALTRMVARAPLDVAADAPVGARFLRPLGGRLGRARAARCAGAPGAACRRRRPSRGATGLPSISAPERARERRGSRESFRTRVTGLDISEAMIERARRSFQRSCPATWKFLGGDAERLPFTDGSLDLVPQISVPVFFDEVARVLAPRGYEVVVSSLGQKTPFTPCARASGAG